MDKISATVGGGLLIEMSRVWGETVEQNSSWGVLLIRGETVEQKSSGPILFLYY